jgi:hypothetical protein
VEDENLQKKLLSFIQDMAREIEKKQENLTSCQKS